MFTLLHPSSSPREGPVPHHPPLSARLPALDALRAVAVALVLFHHWDEPLPAGLPAGLAAGLRTVREAGWIGVDLFFVLSGFLVAGLLFREWRERGAAGLRVGRFLVRRGFKIYPQFYAFLLVVVLLPLVRGKAVEWPRVAAEATFMQSYFPRYQIHTWSLAVEEHFYLLLPLYLLWLARRARGSGGDDAGAPTAVPRHFLVLALGTLAARVATSRLVPYGELHGYATHLRLDSLGFGVLLAYGAHFHGATLAGVVRRWAGPILAGSAGCLLPAFVLAEKHPFMHTLGFTGLYLGFGGVLLVTLYGPWRGPGWLVGAMAWVGASSYGIYLWHMVVRTYGLMALEGVWHRPVPYGLGLAIYLAGSVLLGWVTGRIIERPALALRERWFPARDDRAVAGALRAAGVST